MIVANMIVHDEPPLLLKVTLPALQSMCDRVVVLHHCLNVETEMLCQDLARPDDVFIRCRQDNPVDYARERNLMLAHVPHGEWALKWDPDELPSDRLRDEAASYLNWRNAFGAWMIPIYHLMKSSRTCLPMEVGGYHLRFFRHGPNVRFHGHVHEQPSVMGPIGQFTLGEGFAFLHFSYFCERRLAQKGVHYANVPGSGFVDANDLVSRLTMPTVPLPDDVQYTTPPGWLEEVYRVL